MTSRGALRISKMKVCGWGGRLALLLFAGIGLECGFGAVFQVTSASDLLMAADEVLKQVIRLRGLKPQAPLQRGVKSRVEIAQYLNERIREEYEEIEIQREGKVLRKLGFIPPAMDYKNFVLKLLTEQVGGYYDPARKTLFIADWLSAEMQKPVMAHELTHALQDQHFDLNRFVKGRRRLENDDLQLAQQAVIEGDGMAVMLDYILEPTGRGFSQLPNLVAVMRTQLLTLDSQFEVLRQAPMFLKESLLFPYFYGVTFLQRIRSNRPWTAVNRIYSDLPTSTEQIIHPEKYLGERDNPRPVKVDDPAPHLGKTWKTTYRNVLGEFSIYLLLKLYLSEEQSLEASSGWGGDQLLLAEEDGESRYVLFLESVWDTVEDAEEFYQALGAWFQRRFPQGRKEDESYKGYAWLGGGEYHSIQWHGSRIRFIIGLPIDVSPKLRSSWR